MGLSAVSIWLPGTTVDDSGNSHLMIEQADAMGQLERSNKQTTEGTPGDLIRRIHGLKEDGGTHAPDVSTVVRTSLEPELAAQKWQIAAVLEQGEEARLPFGAVEESLEAPNDRRRALIEERARLADRVHELEGRVAQLDGEVDDVTRQRDALRRSEHALRRQAARLGARVDHITRQRDASRRAERALRSQVAGLEAQIENVADDRAVTRLWFADWVSSNVRSLQELFLGTGVDLEALVDRATEDGNGVGGPVQGIDAMSGLEDAGTSDPMGTQIRRLNALQRLASSMPLGSPVDQFRVTSSYGKRKDPFTKRWAFHGGLDLGAAPGSEILATAAGQVTYAGPNGPYGNMVEIDHGMGVVTRYGHMERVDVEVMDRVEFRQSLGIIGSTGRSTFRHLHYEVRIDDKAYDPTKFLEAGRYLVDLFNFRPGHPLPVAAEGPPPPKPET